MATTMAITEPVEDAQKAPPDEAKPQEVMIPAVEEPSVAPMKVFTFQFPPFPPVPEGKTIIPFKDFKPKGIIPADSDEDEFDAEGVRTVRLPVKHIPDPEERAAYERAKRARKRRKGTQGAGLGPASKKREDAPLKVWYEDWEDNKYRERVTPVDPHASQEDRFAQIIIDFQTDRNFPRSIQSVYDNFRIFCGLLENVQNPPGSKRNKRRKKESSDHEVDMSDEGDAGGEQDDDPGPAGSFSDDDEVHEAVDIPAPSKIEEVPKEEEEKPSKRSGFGGKLPKAVPWSDIEKKDRFLDDPETMLKLFFSHYFYERGMIWDAEKRRTGPLLIKSILEYIIRHGTMKESKAAFERALKVVERARIEQPAVGELADVLPDAYHIACREHFGRWDIGMWGTVESVNWTEPASKPDPDAPPLPTEGWGSGNTDNWGSGDWGSGDFGKMGLVTDDDLREEGMSIDPATSDGWALPAEVTADPLAEDGEVPAAATTEKGNSSWDVAPSWEAAKLPSLTEFYPDPPKDMKIIRVEHSVRQILSVEPPNPNSA
ncbi:hypothetical protein FRB90_005870, partial [Tulasnella sp. 427]